MALNTNSEDRTEPTKLHYNRSMDQKNGRQNSARSNCIKKIQYRYMAEVWSACRQRDGAYSYNPNLQNEFFIHDRVQLLPHSAFNRWLLITLMFN